MAQSTSEEDGLPVAPALGAEMDVLEAEPHHLKEAFCEDKRYFEGSIVAIK
jgi:hypothetical protein